MHQADGGGDAVADAERNGLDDLLTDLQEGEDEEHDALDEDEDQTGLDVTGLFWLENVTVGVAHLCKGEFFEELLDLLLSRPTREAALPAARPREETMVSGYSYLLQEAFEQYGRGMG